MWRSFYFAIALTVALVVAVGCGRTVNAGLMHPPSPRPWILYLHVATFTAWVLLFLTQAALVRVRRIAWHRRLGVAGVVLGALMPVVGIWTALVMARLHRAESHNNHAGEAFLIVSLFDMFAFAITFGLAIYWRRRPEYHRRLMLMASCGLTVAAFARFPAWLMPKDSWYVAVDVLIAVGAGTDWLVLRRIHRVHLYSVPILALGQATAMWIYRSASPTWMAIAHALLSR